MFSRQNALLRPRRLRAAAIHGALGVAAALLLVAPASANHTAPRGYIELSDGTKLKYVYLLPLSKDDYGNPIVEARAELRPGEAPVPTLFYYQGYGHGFPTDASDRDPAFYRYFFDDVLAAGYAVVSVSARGAGCSSGRFEPFSRQEGRDGREVIDWISRQPWSNGKVAMFGLSYAGIEQLVVAAEPPSDPTRPDPLVAIAPGKVLADAYRDASFPGGIPNVFISGFDSQQASSATRQTIDESDPDVFVRNGQVSHRMGDNDCAAHQVREPNPFATALLRDPAAPATGWWDDEFWRERSPIERADRIDVPVFAVNTWQDQLVGSRGTDFLSRVSGPYHAILMNGTHDMYVPPEELLGFLDHYVRGVDNGYGDKPRVRLWWETTGRVDKTQAAWETGTGAWPPPQAKVERFHLADGTGEESGGWNGRLSATSSPGAPDAYSYLPGTGQATDPPAIGSDNDLDRERRAARPAWSAGPRPDASLAYTSDELARDLVVAGSASLDLWLASTAPDTDVQVVLTEVRREAGQTKEIYVQNGLLRASHRTLDPARSTPTRPYHTHLKADEAKLPLGEAVPLRVEIFPFAHVFRRGSRLRVWIEAPRSVPDYWSLSSFPVPAANTVHHDTLRPSSLALSVLPGRSAGADPAPCGTPAQLFCRLDPVG